MKLRFHFLEGFRVHEVLLYVDSSGFSGFNSLQKIMCEGKAVSIKYQCFTKEGSILGGKETCIVESVSFPADLHESAVYKPVCCIISSEPFKGQLVSLLCSCYTLLECEILTVLFYTLASLHKLSELWFSALDNLWDVVYPEIRILTHSSLFLLLYTLFLAFFFQLCEFIYFPFSDTAFLDLLYLSSLILLKFRTFYSFICSFMAGVFSFCFAFKEVEECLLYLIFTIALHPLLKKKSSRLALILRLGFKLMELI